MANIDVKFKGYLLRIINIMKFDNNICFKSFAFAIQSFSSNDYFYSKVSFSSEASQ